MVIKWSKEKRWNIIKRAKKEIEKFFNENCVVTEWEKEKQNWGEILFSEKEQKKQIKCRLCRSPKIAVKNGVLPAEIIYDAVLLFCKEDVILAGSKIEMKKEEGEVFRSVGEMVSYSTHNEIALKREDVI